MATKRTRKTVAFFEVCDENETPMAPADWQSILRDLDLRRIDGGMRELRHEIDAMRHYVQMYTMHESNHLVVARERDEPPSSLDERTGEIVDEETDANRPWVEVSVLSFVPGTNIFGFVLGSMGSPRPSALADWINVDGQIFGELVTMRPYISDELVAMVQDGSSEARMVSLRLDGAQIQRGDIGSDGLYSASKRFGRELDLGPEVDLEVILTIRGRSDTATEATRRSLADIGRSLIGRDMRGGKVEVVDVDPGAALDKELVDLVKHRIATKETISVMDADGGHQVRIPSAINAIYRAADKLGIEMPPIPS